MEENMEENMLKSKCDNQYYFAFDGLKFISALLIVYHHMPILKPSSADIGNVVVLFFFIISGFLITLGYRNRIVEYQVNYRQFIINRVATIFPIQWLMTLLFVFFVDVVSYWAIPFHLTLTQSLIPLWKINFTLNVPSWFLSSIFICYLFTPLLFVKWTKSRRRFFFLLIMSFFLWNFFLYVLPDSIGHRWLCYINPFARLLDYSVGVLLALYWEDIKVLCVKTINGKFIASFLELIVLLVFLLECFLFPDNRIVIYFTIVSLIVVFGVSKGIISKFLGNSIMRLCGSISITILCVMVLFWSLQIIC